MNYPKSLEEYKPLELKLSIKSSLPKLKPTLALLYLIWKSNNTSTSILYSKEIINENNDILLQLDDDVKTNLTDYLTNFIKPSDISIFLEKIKTNNLLTSQIESLKVALELVWKLGEVSFHDKRKSFSAERQKVKGKQVRYNKIINFTSNIDFIDVLISTDEAKYIKLLCDWILEIKPVDTLLENNLIRILTLISESAVYRLRIKSNEDIIFRNVGIYESLDTFDEIELKGNFEPLGSLRILQKILKEELNSYLSGRNNMASKNNNISDDQLKSYASRVSKSLELSSIKIENNLSNDEKENQKHSDIIGKQIIFFGPPGTGKSFNIQNYIRKKGLTSYGNQDEHPNVFRTTLHPESSYHDFVGQIMPVVTKDDEGKDLIKYDFKPQVFTLALEKAFDKSDEPIFLILEEMSRANVAAVFGDIFQLLDRNEDGRSEYLIDNELIQKYLNDQFKEKGINISKIYIPNNLFIIGTVNTSDQNVFVMDTAFKRRFEFEYLDANYVAKNEAGKALNNFVFSIGSMNFSWINFTHNLNDFIVDDINGLGLSEDKQLGQFFIKFNLGDNELTEQSLAEDIEDQVDYSVNFNKLKGKLLQYLWNDIRGASYSDKSLFDNKIKSFGELYKRFENKEQVFSNDFLEKFRTEESENEIQN